MLDQTEITRRSGLESRTPGAQDRDGGLIAGRADQPPRVQHPNRPAQPKPRGRIPFLPLLLLLFVATAVSAVVSMSFGSEPLPVSEVWEVVKARVLGNPGPDPVFDTIVWELRAPRILMAMIVGAGLAMAGAAMQTLVRNPLADPYLLGISAGAGVGATLVIMFGALATLGVWALSLGALVGALTAAAIVFGISIAQGGLTPLRLILTGVVMAAAFSSISSFLVFFSDDRDAVRSVLHWMLGSIAGAMWSQLLPAFITVVVCTVILLLLHSWLDALAGGEDVAAALGVPVRGLRLSLFC